MRKHFVYSTLLFVMLGIAASCQKETTPSEQYIKETILGKWKNVSVNDVEILTNSRTVETFNPYGGRRTSLIYGNWMFQIGSSYSVSGNKIIIPLAPDAGGETLVETVLNMDNSTYEASVVVKEGSTETTQIWKFVRIYADYHVSIIGTWEGVEMTG